MQLDVIPLRHPALDLDLYYINWVMPLMRMLVHLGRFLIHVANRASRAPHSPKETLPNPFYHPLRLNKLWLNAASVCRICHCTIQVLISEDTWIG